MISMSITGLCNTCQNIDLHLREATVWAGDKQYVRYQLECSHAAVCGKLLEEMENRRISAPEEEE